VTFHAAAVAPGSVSELTEAEADLYLSDFEELESEVEEPSAKAGKRVSHGRHRAIDVIFADIKSV
jgi:hypothetical protein